MRSFLFLLIVLVAGLSSCLDTEVACTKEVSAKNWTTLDQTSHQQNIAAIDSYLNGKGIVAIQDVSGLRYTISQAGTGGTPSCLESNITVTYEGRLLSSGAVFDASSTAVSFPLNRLIIGWQIAFLKLNKGTKATLYIPAGLAYGSQAHGGIPANSNLVFDVTLVNFQ